VFDYISYIKQLTSENVLCQKEGFQFCTCSGVNYLEELLRRYQRWSSFVAVSDVCDETTGQRGGGWTRRRLFTTFILRRFKYGDMTSQRAARDLCREVYRQFQSRLLFDEDKHNNRMLFLNFEDIRSQELGGEFINGCTGLYFMLTMDEPTDISYNAAEWDAGTSPATFDATFC